MLTPAVILLAAGVWFVQMASGATANNEKVSAETVKVRLPEKATVVGPKVTLREIAEINARNKAVVSRLGQVVICLAAPAGKTIKLNASAVRIALKKAGIRETIVLEGADETSVKTESQSLNTADLLPSVKALIIEKTGEESENVEVAIPTTRSIIIPAGTITTRVSPPLSGKFEGSQLFTVEIQVDGRLVKNQSIRVQTEVRRSAVVVIQRVERGEKLTDDNIVFQRVTASRVSEDTLRNLPSALGRTTARMMVPGTVVRIGDLLDPPMVKRNSTVEAVVQKGNLEVAVEAKALEDGKAGQIIRIQNASSGKIFKAKVVDEKTVQVVEPPKKK